MSHMVEVAGPAIGAVIAIIGVVLSQRLGQKERQTTFERQSDLGHQEWLREKRYEACHRLWSEVMDADLLKDAGEYDAAFESLVRVNRSAGLAAIICRWSFMEVVQDQLRTLRRQVVLLKEGSPEFDREEYSVAYKALGHLINIELRGPDIAKDPFLQRHAHDDRS